MSCGCSSTPAPIRFSSTCTATGSSSCPMPRRVSSPPVTPVVFPWVAQVRQSYEGQLMIRNGDELQALDAPFSGQIWFDTNTGKASVGTFSATSVEDTTPCVTEDLAGFPLYGLGPGCRDLGQNPDRSIGILRPKTTNTGWLYAHDREGPPGPGLKAELIPREINPAVLPDVTPSGLRMLVFRRVPATDDCTPATLQWFEATGLLPVDEGDLGTTTVTPAELQDITPDFNFLVTRLVDGQWKTWRLTNESFKSLINTTASSGITWLANAKTLLFQHRSIIGGGSSGLIYFPPVSAAGPLPITDQSAVIDLTAQEGYTPEATSVMLEFRLVGGTFNQQYSAVLVANGREYARITLGAVAAGSANSDTCYNQVQVRIPTNKLLPLNFYYRVDVPGNPTSLLAQVDLVAFIK